MLASIAVLAAVYGLQYGRSVAPCPLCLYQRWPYFAAIPLSAAALMLRSEGFPIAWSQAAMALAALAFAAGAGLAAYHFGIEQHWWSGPAACSGVGAGGSTLEDLRASLLATPPVRCDQVAWSIFGISLAALNVLASSGLAVFSGMAAWRLRSR